MLEIATPREKRPWIAMTAIMIIYEISFSINFKKLLVIIMLINQWFPKKIHSCHVSFPHGFSGNPPLFE
jgi:hypothetical protein